MNHNHKNHRHTTCVVLVVCICLSVLSIAAFAEEVETTEITNEMSEPAPVDQDSVPVSVRNEEPASEPAVEIPSAVLPEGEKVEVVMDSEPVAVETIEEENEIDEVLTTTETTIVSAENSDGEAKLEEIEPASEEDVIEPEAEETLAPESVVIIEEEQPSGEMNTYCVDMIASDKMSQEEAEKDMEQMGDVNHDGAVDYVDVRIVVYYSFFGGDCGDRILADMNGDGRVNLADAVLLARKIV